MSHSSDTTIALDIDHTSLIGNDTDGLCAAIDAYDTLDDINALALFARLINPRLLELFRHSATTVPIVFYTAKYMIARALKGVAPDHMWVMPHTIRLAPSTTTSSRDYLYRQVPAVEDLKPLGLVTWALARLLGHRTSPAVYIADEPKNPLRLGIPGNVILYDDMANVYAHATQAPPAMMRQVAPFTFACLTRTQAQALEAFLVAHCPHVDAQCAPTLYHDRRWRIVEHARGLGPGPPWPSIRILIDASPRP
jgi:hypothetical protein